MSAEEKFAIAEAHRVRNGGFTRIDEVHPVDLFVGVQDGHRAVIVLCPVQPPDIVPFAAIVIESRQRQDGRWALSLILRRTDLKPLFTKLVDDLVMATRHQPDDPGRTVITRILRWQHLLAGGTPGLLEDRELRGLCAELDFLLKQAIPVFGPAAVASWVGPYDAPKDFQFDEVDVEVKATRPQAREVQISSLEQLTDSAKPLFLWLRDVDLTEVMAPGRPTVASLVASVREAVATDPAASSELEIRLEAARYENRVEYDGKGILFGEEKCFEVTAAFPRLQRHLVSPGITGCKYTLAIQVLREFSVRGWRGRETDVRRDR